jgi:hypothetical protein
MDSNYINDETINTDILKKYLNRNDWDGLSFNKNSYYDTWALSIHPYYLSCWHWTKPLSIIDIMSQYLRTALSKLKEDELLPCVSAFCGFSIYRIEKFLNCNYSGLLNLNILKNFDIRNNIKLLESNNMTYSNKFVWKRKDDCEHRYFHMEAILKNKARIRISPLKLFETSV